MKLWSFAFAFLFWASCGSADTGVYNAECTAPNIFVDQNSGETYCYRVARYYSEDFLTEGDQDDAECRVAKNICEEKTQLKFDGEQRSATIVTINSALENEFIFNLLNAEFSKLNENERALAKRKVLLYHRHWTQSGGDWEDHTDPLYLEYRYHNTTSTDSTFLYVIIDSGEWSYVHRTLQKSDFENGKFGFVLCKARFKKPSTHLMAAPMDNRVFECEPTLTANLAYETVCFYHFQFKQLYLQRMKKMLLSEVLHYFTKWCDITNLQIHKSNGPVVVQSKMLTLKDAKEMTVLRSVLGNFTSMYAKGKLRAMLPFFKGVYLDGSDAEHLKKILNFADNSEKICGAAVSLIPPHVDVRPVNCVDEDANTVADSFFCEGRFPLNAPRPPRLTEMQVSRFVYDCIPANKIPHGDGRYHDVFCYNVTMMTEGDLEALDDKSDYADFASRCESTKFSYEGEVKTGTLTSLNVPHEDQFINRVLVRRFLRKLTPAKEESFSKYSNKFLLGVQKDGWRDGSDTELLKKSFPNYTGIQTNTCGFLKVDSEKWTIEKCTQRKDYKGGKFQFVVCKARFTRKTTTTSTMSSTMTSTRTPNTTITATSSVFTEPEEAATKKRPLLLQYNFFECNATTILVIENTAYCYSVVPMVASDLKDGKNERDLAEEKCHATLVHLNDEIMTTSLISLQSGKETAFVADIVIDILERSNLGDRTLFASRIVLGARTSFLRSKINVSKLTKGNCAFYDVSSGAFEVGKCGTVDDFFPGAVSFVVCKSYKQLLEVDKVFDEAKKQVPSPWDSWRPRKTS